MEPIIDVFVQNSIRVTTDAGKVYIDPFRMKDEPKDADLILITHDHFDHFSPEDIARVCREGTVMAVPEKMLEKARREAGFIGQITAVRPGESYTVGGFSFETVPAYNQLKPFHPKSAGWVGYILNADGKRVYVAGDTDATKEARAVRCDIALVPVGGTYTMDAKKAAELIGEIRPETAIPVHYGSVVGSPKDGEKFAALVKAPVRVEIRHAD